MWKDNLVFYKRMSYLNFLYKYWRCGRLLGGTDLLCVVFSCSFCCFLMWCFGSGVVLGCIIPDLCPLLDFE